MNRFALAAIVSLILLSSCHMDFHRIGGSGNVVSQSRDFASSFNAIEVENAISVYIKQDSSYSVKVETDDNLQQYIQISESNGTLYIRQEDHVNLRSTGKIKVYVTAPEFKRLEASGASSIVGQNQLTNSSPTDIRVSGASEAQLDLNSPKVTLDVTGASEINLRGKTRDLSAEATGASTIKGFEMLSENAEIGASGASRAEIFASVKINANASGASEVYYKGNGALTKDESGASNVRKAD